MQAGLDPRHAPARGSLLRGGLPQGELLRYVHDQGYRLAWILDTHPHADHFSAAGYIKDKTGAPTGIGERVIDVQKLWKDIYNLPEFPADGSQWD
ncbi:hypothetical protein SLNSH_23750, partial [Alsobacter soli]